MPSYTASIQQPAYNASNITLIHEGPLIDYIRREQFFILLPSIIYAGLLMLIGFPGNFLVIVVYLFKMAKTTSRHFIISLAICDFINCAFGMPVELSFMWNSYNFDFPILCKVSRFSTFFMNNTSCLVLVGIAVDRFRRVCMPLKPNMTVQHSKVICICAAVFSMLSAAPALFIYGTKTLYIPGPINETKFVLKTCYIGDSVGTKMPLVFNLYLFIGILTIFSSLAVMYALVGKVVCGSKKMKNQNSMYPSRSKSLRTPGSPSRYEKTLAFSTRMLRSISENSPRILRTGQKSPRLNGSIPDVTEPLAIRDRTHSDTSVRRHGGKEIRAGRTTMILFIVTLVLVLSFVPYLGIVTMRYINPSFVKFMTTAGRSVYNFTLRSYLLNSAVNPIIYCFLNRQFKLKVKLLFLSVFKCRR